MSLLELFGRGAPFRAREGEAEDYLPIIERGPVGVEWRRIRPRSAMALRAWRAGRDGLIAAPEGVLRYQSGRDWIVEHSGGDYAVVRNDIFVRTYEDLGSSRFRRRDDVRLRYFRLPHRARIRTLEGLRRAERGDWIIEGLTGELWPVNAEKARRTYTEE
jgi:hypothetical protein